MEKVGVEFIIEGLQAFMSGMGQANSALNKLRPSATLLEQAFTGLLEGIGNFGREVLNVIEVALGVMLRDAINFIIQKLADLVSAIIETGNEFQLLKIRLTGLNLNEFADGTRSYAEAMALAGQKTAEEISWLQTLGAQTPFDPAQIADTYTQARAFGFSADEAKRLTTDIINYTAAMGLSNETLFLVIQNLGQMVQRGKITGTEIRDLARGSFLPLGDVLDRIAVKLGVTTKELTKMISTPGEGVPAQLFVQAFEEMVEQEPRFIGAAGRLARAFVPATQNVKELITSIFGLNVVTPIFDILGEAVAKVVDVFVAFDSAGNLVKTGYWNNLVAAATNLGIAIGEVVKKFLGMAPSGEVMALALINAIQSVATWIRDNKDKIVAFFVGIANAVDTYVIKPFLRITEWVTTNWGTITAFFKSLGEIITTVFGNLFGGAFAKGDFLGGVLDALKTFMQYVTENKEQIAAWATAIIRVIAVVEILLTVFNIAIGIIGAVIGFFLSLAAAVVSVIGILTILLNPISWVVAAMAGLAAGTALLALWVFTRWAAIQTATTNLSSYLTTTFNNLRATLVALVSSLGIELVGRFTGFWNNIRSIGWVGLGNSIMQGIGQGIRNAAGWLANTVRSAVMNAYYAALNALGIRSPSKLFAEIGENTMEGFAVGVQKYAGVAAGAMTSAMQRVAVPAVVMPGMVQMAMARGAGSTTSNTDARQYNLTIHSNADTEPILQDYGMMQSLAGV